MKRKRILFMMVVLSIFVVSGVGCSKKTEIRQDAAAQQAPVAETKKVVDDKAAKEKTARDEAARRKALEDEAMRQKAPKAEAVTSVLTDIHFDFDKYVIASKDRAVLDKIAAWLKQSTPKMMTIEGHCDERGTTEYNLALGEKRAVEAKKYLVSLGVSAKILNTISYGEERPLDPGHNEEAWAKNRRDHFLVK
ncbi:MAG: peptidoglycan-associated lipoprotein Pal [Syntrophales bacterium]|nr:peptidoglycan-associated lipoprotein Pal [Syntrophales bacterium]